MTCLNEPTDYFLSTYNTHDEELQKMIKEELLDVIVGLVEQFAYERKDGKYFSGGVSALESAFGILIEYGCAVGDSLVIELVRRDKR